MANIQLTTQQLETIRHVLSQVLPGSRCMVFGSRVKGTAKKYSDLDLAIDNGEPIPLNQLAILNGQFDESELPFTVDVVDWYRIDDDFRAHISEYALDIKTALL